MSLATGLTTGRKATQQPDHISGLCRHSRNTLY